MSSAPADVTFNAVLAHGLRVHCCLLQYQGVGHFLAHLLAGCNVSRPLAQFAGGCME